MIRDDFLEGGHRICPVCGKEFWTTSQWLYRRGSGNDLIFFCSYKCMRARDRTRMTKKDKIRQAIRDGLKDNEIMKLLGVKLETVLDVRWSMRRDQERGK